MKYKKDKKSPIFKKIATIAFVSLMIACSTTATHVNLDRKTGRYFFSNMPYPISRLLNSPLKPVIEPLYNLMLKRSFKQQNKKNMVGKEMKNLGQEYFYRLFESKLPGFLGKASVFIQRNIHKCPPIYDSDLTGFAVPSLAAYYYRPFGIVQISGSIQKFKGILQHEMAHAWQYSSYLMRLKIALIRRRGGGKKLCYFREYQAEQKTVEQMYKEKNYETLTSMLEIWTSILVAVLRPYFGHPYKYGALDAYFKLLKKNPTDQKLKNCFPNNWMNLGIKKIYRNFEPKNWKDRYRNYSNNTK